MTEASLLHRGCYGFHGSSRGCKPGALPVAVGWRCPRRLHRRCAAFARPPPTVKRAGRLPTLPGKRSAPCLAGVSWCHCPRHPRIPGWAGRCSWSRDSLALTLPGSRTIVMLTPFQARTGGSCALDGAPHRPRGPGLPWRRCDRSPLGLPGEAVSGVPAISQLPPPCRYLLRPGCPGDSAPPGTRGTSLPGRHTRSPPRRAAGPGTARARSQPPG